MAWTEKYVRDDAAGGGDGSTNTNSGGTGAFTWAEMLADTTANTSAVRYNVRSGTYTRSTTAETFTTSGQATFPRAVRGFNVTPGDLEANGRTPGGLLVTTNFPVITYTTGRLSSPAFCIVEFLSITSAAAAATFSAAASCTVRRCSLANNHVNSSGAVALSVGGTGHTDDCDCTCASSNAASGAISGGVNGHLISRCYCKAVSGQGIGIGAGAPIILQCVFDSCLQGINSSTSVNIDGCSFRNCGTCINSIGIAHIMNCVAWGNGGTTKWYNSTTTVHAVYQGANFVGNMGAADTNVGDWNDNGKVALSADPFVSSSDFRLNNTAGGGVLVRGAATLPYMDGGAWQVQPAAAGGSYPFGS